MPGASIVGYRCRARDSQSYHIIRLVSCNYTDVVIVLVVMEIGILNRNGYINSSVSFLKSLTPNCDVSGFSLTDVDRQAVQ